MALGVVESSGSSKIGQQFQREGGLCRHGCLIFEAFAVYSEHFWLRGIVLV